LDSCARPEEQHLKGEVNITPYWRTLKTGGLLNDKYPCGIDGQRVLLESEGHTVVQKGKKIYVFDFERALAAI
jgi:hypothetical protein